MKYGLLITAAGLALGLSPALAAQEVTIAEEDQVDLVSADAEAEEFIFLSEEEQVLADLEASIGEAFAMLSAIFKVEPLTEEQEARVPLGAEMAGHIMPDGAFGVAMNETLQPMMTMIMGVVTDDPRIRLAEISGVDADDLADLTDEAAQEALDIFDPQFALRTERTSGLMVGMIGKVLEAVEPAYREGMARAFAVRFDEAEMRELLTFFATPVGGKFAQQSFLVQYDPRMMGVMEAMGPAFVKVIPDMVDEITAIEAELGTARDFSELSAAERRRAARLIGKSARELDALVPDPMLDAEESDDLVT